MKGKLPGQTSESLTVKKCIGNTRKLTPATALGLFALALCLVAPRAVASLSNPVTRPLVVVEGHLTITVDSTGAYTFTDWGWATHTGLYYNSGSGGPGALNQKGEFVAGSGVVIAANGDTLEWVVGPTPNLVSYTGGTGRFQGVTGGFVAVITSVTPLSSTATTQTLLITYEGTGTITY